MNGPAPQSPAARVLARRSEILDAFHVPHPDRRGGGSAMVMGDGQSLEVPRSQMSEAVDLLARRMRLITARTPSLAPAVAVGLSRGRAYRVQENMTPALIERADTLPVRTRIFDDIRPPRPCGFAWLEEPLPFQVDANPDHARHGIVPALSAVSWAAIVDDSGRTGPGRPLQPSDARDLLYVVCLWDDMSRFGGWRTVRHGYDSAVPGMAIAPVTVGVWGVGHILGTPRMRNRLDEVLADDIDDSAAARIMRSSLRAPIRTVAALWQMLGETVEGPAGHDVERSGEDVDRRTARRARNTGVESSEVTTVVLRRQARPVINPGSGSPMTSRIKIDEYEAWRWVGSEKRGDRRRVRRMISAHWSNGDESLPVRERKIVSELRR